MESIGFNYNQILNDISELCKKSGRDPASVKLICVSKTHSREKIIAAYNAGARLFGENKVQEAMEKFPLGPEFSGVELHYIGRLQSNKLRKIFPLANVFHSIDSIKILQKLQNLGEEFQESKKVFLQVNISGESTKAGFTPQELMGLIPELEGLTKIKFSGLMGIGPNTSNEDKIRKSFSALKNLLSDIQNKYGKNMAFLKDFKELSMGMSHDFPLAIEEGSHYLRIGTAIFGNRDYSTAQ